MPEPEDDSCARTLVKADERNLLTAMYLSHRPSEFRNQM